MPLKEITLPAMGEGITEASIIRWLVSEGDTVKKDQPLVEIATDKVDSEIHSPYEGIIKKIISVAGTIPRIGDTVALVVTANSEGKFEDSVPIPSKPTILDSGQRLPDSNSTWQLPKKNTTKYIVDSLAPLPFIPPFVRLTACRLGINLHELAAMVNKKEGDVFSKHDLEMYIANKPNAKDLIVNEEAPEHAQSIREPLADNKPYLPGTYTGTYRIEEMGRVRKRIATNMLRSSNTIPHVTSYIEADATNLVRWRESNKDLFFERYNTKLTFTPLFIEAMVHALKQYPEVNVSVDADSIIYKDDINIGMATILPDKDLIVPVVKQANLLSLSGLAFAVNDLSHRARNKDLKPNEITGSTFSFTNIGVFGSLTGTPLINIPEAAILAIGAINKKPAAVPSSEGYAIGLRDIVMLSLAYDHRVIDGGLGGMFLKSVAHFIENFNMEREV